MTTISIMPEKMGEATTGYLAVAGPLQSAGKTPGEALDALTSQLGEGETGTLVIVQQMRPDRFFTEAQQQRLTELMERWRTARDQKTALSAQEQAELEALAQAELKASADRAAALVDELKS